MLHHKYKVFYSSYNKANGQYVWSIGTVNILDSYYNIAFGESYSIQESVSYSSHGEIRSKTCQISSLFCSAKGHYISFMYGCQLTLHHSLLQQLCAISSF